MICLIALIVFGILGIFSATHRKIALEAFDCVFRRLTIRKCTSGLDKRLKSQITGKLINKSPKVAKFTYKNFELISWFFTIIMILSIVYSGMGAYKFVMYGNCNGEDSQEACVYNGLSDVFNNNDLKIDVGCESPLCDNKDCGCKGEINCQEGIGELCNQTCEES